MDQLSRFIDHGINYQDLLIMVSLNYSLIKLRRDSQQVESSSPI